MPRYFSRYSTFSNISTICSAITMGAASACPAPSLVVYIRICNHFVSRLSRVFLRQYAPHAQSGMRMLREAYMAPRRMLWRSQIKNYAPLPGGRHSRGEFPVDLNWKLQRGTINYRYRDVPMLKHPVEVALYMRLIWETRPATIVEIGSQSGGAAVWMADLLNLFGIPGTSSRSTLSRHRRPTCRQT